MSKATSTANAAPHIIVETRKQIATCPACTRRDLATTRITFGPPWMAMHIRLCADCLGELREALPERVKP